MVCQPEDVGAVTLGSNHPLLATFSSVDPANLVFHSHAGFLLHSATSHKVRVRSFVGPFHCFFVFIFWNLCCSTFWDTGLVIGWLSHMTPHPWCLWYTQCMACFVMEGQLSYLIAAFDHPAQVPIKYLTLAVHRTMPSWKIGNNIYSQPQTVIFTVYMCVL